MKLTFRRMTKPPRFSVACGDCDVSLAETFDRDGEWFWNFRRRASIKALCGPCYELRRVQQSLALEQFRG